MVSEIMIFSVLIVCSYLLDVFLHSSLLLGWSSFSEILVIEGMVRKIVAENSFHGSNLFGDRTLNRIILAHPRRTDRFRGGIGD